MRREGLAAYRQEPLVLSSGSFRTARRLPDLLRINFGARQIVDYGFSIGITGHIDRASGRMDVTTITLDPTKPNDPDIATLRYDVVCKGDQ